MNDQKAAKLKARLPRGLADRGPAEIAATRAMTETIRAVFERYGFEPLETPAFEYTDALGKFLPDQDRPNEGVFSFKDDDEQWLSLRYDLTAPLARYVAENFDTLPKPFRSYRFGWVFRNEKPGPGRYRQFMQFDADTVGAASPAADAEMCMMAADTMEALGIPRGSYLIKVNSRKVLDGLMESRGLGGDANAAKRLIVLRAIDKVDRIGIEGVRALLGPGRKDESGDFTPGAKLDEKEIERVLTLWNPTDSADLGNGVTQVVSIGGSGSLGVDSAVDAGQSQDMEPVGATECVSNKATLSLWEKLLQNSPGALQGIRELRDLIIIAEAAGYGSKRIRIDSSVVRGLEYYTGAVYEAELTFEIRGSDGRPVRFGSVGGGGRYDGLVGRFRPEPVPATGFSIGVSRLQAALTHLGKLDSRPEIGPVVVLVLDRDRISDYQRLVQKLRDPDDGGAAIRAELYLGSSGMKAQMKYADRRGAPCVIIQGSDELARGEVQIKDLIEGAKAADVTASREEWREARPAQFAVKQEDMVAEVRKLLARHGVAPSPRVRGEGWGEGASP